MTPYRKFLLLLLPLPLLIGLAGMQLRQVEQTEGSYTSPQYKAAAAFWGGNPAEVYSHCINMVACSGVHALLLYVLWAERFLRRREVGWIGSWSLWWGGLLAAGVWLMCVGLDGRGGEGVVFLCVPIFFIPLLAIILMPAHLLLCRVKHAGLDALISLGMACCLYRSQLLFEPSDSGAPNSSILTVALLAIFLLWPPAASLLLFQRRALRQKGYQWAGWRSALFFALNGTLLRGIPPRDELAVLPEYEEGNDLALCGLLRHRRSVAGA